MSTRHHHMLQNIAQQTAKKNNRNRNSTNSSYSFLFNCHKKKINQ